MELFNSAALNIIINAALIFISIAILWKGADFLVESAGRIAVSLGVSDLVIGLTIVAFGTSAPELAVTINAALKQQADISVGNIVGSNIFNLGIIMGTVAIVRSINSSRRLVYRDGVFMIGITGLLLLFFMDLRLAMHEGIIFVILLIIYITYLFIIKEPIEEAGAVYVKAGWKDVLVLIISIASVIIGGHLLVESSRYLAKSAGISEWAIAVTIVAGGTSAPEMATSIAAIMKGKHGMSAGNLIGSDIFNILGILGLAGILNPNMVINSQGYSSIFMLCGMVIITIIFLRTGWRISRKEGIILLSIGILRWVLDIAQGRNP